MSPGLFGRHQRVLTALVREFSRSLEMAECDASVLVELDWIVSADTVIRPDLVIVCGRGPDEYLRQPPVLVAEILNPSTERNDRTFKYQLYQRQGVSYSLLADPSERTLEVHALGPNGTYVRQPNDGAVAFRIGQHCELQLLPERLFR